MDGGVGARAEGSVGWWQVAAQDQLRSARLYTQRRTPLVTNSPRKYCTTIYSLRIHLLPLYVVLCILTTPLKLSSTCYSYKSDCLLMVYAPDGILI